MRVQRKTDDTNYEIMVDMEHYKHELSQVEVSKEDKLKLGRLFVVSEVNDRLPWWPWKR